MPRWLKVIRAMIGTGLIFAAGVGAAAAITGALFWLGGTITVVELMQFAGRFTVVSFLLGVVFSGVLALAARGRAFSRLSIPLVSALGAGAGLLYFIFLALNGGRNWSPQSAIVNFVLLIVMGAGAAAATLFIARRASSALGAGDELPSLNAPEEEIIRGRARDKAEVPRL